MSTNAPFATKTPPVKKAAVKTIVAKKAPAKKAPAKKVVAKTVMAKAPVVKVAPVKKPKVKAPKLKIVRDSFTMPEADFALIDAIKARALKMQQPAKKSEVLRAALQALNALNDAGLKMLLTGLTPIKKGRPKAP